MSVWLHNELLWCFNSLACDAKGNLYGSGLGRYKLTVLLLAVQYKAPMRILTTHLQCPANGYSVLSLIYTGAGPLQYNTALSKLQYCL